jgi:hypothetical protein
VGLRERQERLEEESGLDRMTLFCPECGARNGLDGPKKIPAATDKVGLVV